MEDTIVAVSTPPGQGAIGIIRLSGPDSLKILDKVWRGTPVRSFQPRRIYTGKINDLGDNSVLDRVIVFFMKAPFSYTGEDLVEIQAHGGQRLMELLLRNFIAAGACLAGPGEFTKRAFLNGRIDLAQAEAVADLIAASSSRAATLAGRQLEGGLSAHVKRLRGDLKVLKAEMEARIDFPEDEDVQALPCEEVFDRVNRLSSQIQCLIETYEEGRLWKEGLWVAIVGKPNAGKSTLFNTLLKEDRAIVHPLPGTTRDPIEETLELQGLAVRFIDTAGLRKGGEAVESEGIRRTRDRLKAADLVLVVVDSSRPLDSEDETVFEAVGSGSRERPVFFIYNKIDLPPAFPLKSKSARHFLISALTGEGVDELKRAIFSHFIRSDPSRNSEGPILTSLRHRTALQNGLEALQRVDAGCREKRTLELLAADLSIAMNCLGEVTGEVTNEEILSEIFSRFCIGK